ncbi:hypothetical protein ACFPK5_00380 [Streptomyces beijiangensis]|uniref:hypothetical protein n=1 Tax=Streptomyces beijiangensis TaxID=163361 RepID=UPI0031E34721
MRHLPRHHRVPNTQVNTDTTPAPDGRRVLVVGRFIRPTCDDCDGFQSVRVVIDGQLATVHCAGCTPAPVQASVVDDVQDEDDAQGYEAEDLLVLERAA